MIEFQDVTLYLNNRLILDRLSFAVDEGSSVMLVGNSGAGKSTILRLALGLIRPSSGRIFAFGEEITAKSENELLKIRQNFGMLFQEGALFDSLSVFENVGFFLKENFKLTEAEIRDRVMQQLEFLGLEKFSHYYPAQLSGGMKKRVALARAVVAKPKVMLYDEPSAGLDPASARRVVELISRLQSTYNMTSLVVTHEIHYFVERMSRMIMLRDGNIAYDGQPVADIHDWYENPSFIPIAV